MDKYLQRLKEIFNAIDESYSDAQRHYNFNCKECADNCCSTKFHHHTLTEELYLAAGLKNIGEDKQREIVSRAKDVIKILESSPDNTRAMCPLNENGLCLPYKHRPMICRIHGVPYELFRNFKLEYGDGCYRFKEEKAAADKSFRLKRTGFYFDLAMLEKEVREKLGYTGRYKKTTAEMVLGIFGKKLKAD